MTDLFNVAVGLLLVLGALFTLVAAIGILRLPDVYMRMHAASKAGTLGSGLALIALAVHSLELDVVTRAVAGVVFFMLTAPVSAHLLARAAYLAGYAPGPATRVDDYAGEAAAEAARTAAAPQVDPPVAVRRAGESPRWDTEANLDQ